MSELGIYSVPCFLPTSHRRWELTVEIEKSYLSFRPEGKDRLPGQPAKTKKNGNCMRFHVPAQHDHNACTSLAKSCLHTSAYLVGEVELQKESPVPAPVNTTQQHEE